MQDESSPSPELPVSPLSLPREDIPSLSKPWNGNADDMVAFRVKGQAFPLFFLGSSGVGGARGGGGASSTVMRKSRFVGGVAEPASPVDWDGPAGDKRSVFLWERTSGPTVLCGCGGGAWAVEGPGPTSVAPPLSMAAGGGVYVKALRLLMMWFPTNVLRPNARQSTTVMLRGGWSCSFSGSSLRKKAPGVIQ
ncbi:hypothetical protein EYF80_040848 [Liparis tanakae]|uniref:Uncharacterized protein n=1 Tax=Liparis tanakae TaxID=230148 RepID=A0A4Z2G5W0_9TELE|nr:hypothetical protein EYF80_040848 [Liparis tanakae]